MRKKPRISGGIRIRLKKISGEGHFGAPCELRYRWTPAPRDATPFPVLHHPIVPNAEFRSQSRVSTQRIDQIARHGHRYVTWRDALSNPFFLTPHEPAQMVIMAMPRLTRSDQLKAEVGQRLADTRDALNLSQDDLGDLLGCGRTTIANWEGGRGLADASKMVILKQRYGVTLDWIYTGTMAGLPNDLLSKILELQTKRAS